MAKFTNLHQHSMYSLLDSIAKVDDMIKKAKELGYEALCISDHGVIYNAPETYISCKENNIGYIYACELYICDDRFEKDNNNRYYHLLAMAYNEEGRINLNKIITDAYKNGFYYKPRTDFQFLSEHAEGLIISSACMAGEVSRSIINNDLENAINVIEKYKSVFKENYYLEVQSHDVEEQLELNRKIVDLAKQTNTPYIITNDSHYINKEDAEIHSLFIMNAKDSEVGEIYKDCYMQSGEDVINICSKTMSKDEIEVAFENISKIVSQCIGVELPIKKAEIPMPSLPQGFNNEYDYLRFLVYQGFKEHGLDKKKNKQEYIDRIEYELDALHRMHYDRYLLNIRDQLEGVERVGLGRGCFTEDAMIVTDNGIKKISDVNIGDSVISANNRLNKVKDVFSYDIENENMVEFTYQKQGTVKQWNKNLCTSDHKILVNRNSIVSYIEAGELTKEDMLCSPILKTDNIDIVFDMNKYNYSGFKFDDNYIYEEIRSNKEYKYSPKWLERNKIVNKTFARNIINNPHTKNKRAQKNILKLLSNTPFNSTEEYSKYCLENNGMTKRRVKRFIELNEDFNEFIGMLYGDGFTNNNNIGLAINTTTKFGYNRDLFYKISSIVGLEINEVKHKTKNLIQMYVCSEIFANFIKNEFFESKKGSEKMFNSMLFNQNTNNLKALRDGLMKTDGSFCEKSRKENFDNTSKSIISAMKIIESVLEYEPSKITIREAWVDKRGYNCRESYKLQRYFRKNDNNTKVYRDDKYWYLPITSIKKHYGYSGKVYDLAVENDPSYTINNVIVHNSSAGSVVCWLIGLTKIDSLKYGCYFERFVDVGQLKLIEEGLLSKDKLKMADIDTDVSTSERQRTVEKLFDKYGSDYVCAIGTLNMTWAKSSIKDIARVLGIEASIANEITKTIESMDLTEDVINNEIDEKYKNMYPRLFKIASKITGIARSMSVHASGKIVSDRDLSYYAPIAILNNEQTIMCDMDSVDLFGLLKSDILGLRTLDVIFDTLKMIKKDYSYIDPNLINLNDKKIFKMFGEGKTDSIFQMSSTGMRATLKEMKPDSIEDLTAVNAMFRPGPMANIPHYIKRKHGQEEVEYLHPDLEPILKNTFGIMCYQEQVIELGRYAGLNNPDDLRVATAKKKPAMLEKVKPEFINGLMKKRWTILQIETIWDELLAYAQYSFNRSHSISYSLTAYQTMFLHYYHPLEFWAASLNSVAGKTEELTEFLSAILNEGLNLHVPTYKDINDICFVKDGKIFIGTNIIKGLSARIAHEAEWIKKINITKDNFVDLLIYNEENAETKIGKTTMTILAKVGFFDNVAKREWLIDIIDQFNNGKGLKYSAKLTDKTKAARLNALREYAKSSSPEQARIRDILGWETDYFGVPLSKFAGMPSDYAYIMSIEKSKYTTRDGGASYIFMTYGIADGKVRKLMYNKNTTVFEGGIIQLKKIVEKSAAGKPYKTPVLYEYKKLT